MHTVAAHELDTKKSHLRPFLIWTLASSALVLSWLFLSPIRSIFDSIDNAVFHALNASLDGLFFTQIFWALANIRLSDLFGVLFMFFFFILYMLDAEAEKRHIRFAQLLYTCLWGEIGITLSKQVLGWFLESNGFVRQSPTVTFGSSIMLSNAIPWVKVKDSSLCCCPSDHAEIVLEWLFFVFFFCGRRYGAVALTWSILFFIPRLYSGAHWLSDITVGSFAFVSILFATACHTPIYDQLMPRLIQCTNLLFNKLPFLRMKSIKP
jgi:membrane-associated phospholipid phosphatase